LLDLNVLIALTDEEHVHYLKAQKWFDSSGREDWGVCPLTEAGLVRVTTNPLARNPPHSFEKAADVLADLARRPGYRFWPITDSWAALTAPFAERIFGHQQVTDAYLLGLAIKEDGVLVTFDRGLKYMAGAEFSRNLHILE
jgi:toxin-antitoxin system PIN domain toxin